jgi:glycosyltransferase involved in cell wall biosynthesis
LEGRVVIGFIGLFRNWHGLHLLIDAFHLACLRSKGAVLLLVGDGPELKSIRQKIEWLQIRESVILVGGVPHEVVPEYLDLFDIAVQPAATEYCCPLKILEYMALGKAVVAPRQANVQELLREGEEALLFPPGDALALGRALSELVADPAMANNLGMGARRAIYTRGFLWVRNAERVIHLIVSRNRSAGSRFLMPRAKKVRSRWHII